MIRKPEWEAALSDWIAQAQSRAFKWGQWDCCVWAAGAVEAMTGDDPMAAFRGKYKGPKSADTALASIGAGTLVATLDGMFERIHPAFARTGDLVMFDGNVGVVDMTGAGLFVADAGLDCRPRALWTDAWGVGHG